MAVVAIDDLHKTYRSGPDSVTVFGGLDLQLGAGKSLALVGPSGSGKSTLLNILCGLESFDRGEIALFGDRVTGFGPDAWAGLRRQRIGVVFQEANLMPAMTLAENIRLRAELAGTKSADPQDWLARLGLEGLGQRYPDQVSGGQRQRAALAMVFAMAPGLILMDEPTGSLDRHTATLVADELFRWQAERQCPLILATHDLALAERCDRRLDLAGGGQG